LNNLETKSRLLFIIAAKELIARPNYTSSQCGICQKFPGGVGRFQGPGVGANYCRIRGVAIVFGRSLSENFARGVQSPHPP